MSDPTSGQPKPPAAGPKSGEAKPVTVAPAAPKPAAAASKTTTAPSPAKPTPAPGPAKPAPQSDALQKAADAIKPPSAAPVTTDPVRNLEPVHADEPEVSEPRWTGRLVIFLRVMAVLSMAKGLYHWAVVSGVAGPPDGFEYQPTPWQTATVFFAVIDLVAAVGLWLAAAWGAVVWLTACVSMAAVEVFFPQVYGGRLSVIGGEGVLLFGYLFLAIMSAREHPN